MAHPYPCTCHGPEICFLYSTEVQASRLPSLLEIPEFITELTWSSNKMDVANLCLGS